MSCTENYFALLKELEALQKAPVKLLPVSKTVSADVIHEVDRSNEDFIGHYKAKYAKPVNPPAWMTLEVVSFGTLSRLYELLKKNDDKITIAKSLGLNKIDILVTSGRSNTN